jgi:hypothetical protein
MEYLFKAIQDNFLHSFQVIIHNHFTSVIEEVSLKQVTGCVLTYSYLLGCSFVSPRGGNASGIAVQVMWVDIINYFE